MAKIIKFRKLITFLCILLLIISNNYIQVLAIYSNNESKTVYLTFDDGPSSNNTNKIIDILNKNNIRGTFFVVGDSTNIYPHLIKKLDENNMCIMPHCNFHDYKGIYKCEENYFKDLNTCKENINKIIGNREMNFIRIPGGSDNKICNEEVLNNIKTKILDNGDNYIDWTINIADIERHSSSREFVKSIIMDEGGLYNIEVVLMKDVSGKESNIESLQEIIDFYNKRGYKFKTLNEIEEWEKEYLKEIKVLNK